MASNSEVRSNDRRRLRRHQNIRNDDAVIVLESGTDCIDLTTENNTDDIIDMTEHASGLMDLPVVVLTPTDYVGPVRHRTRRGSGRRGRHRSSTRRNRRNSRSLEASPRQSSAYVYLSDESDSELPDPANQPEASSVANSSVLQSPENVSIVCPICLDDTRQMRRNFKELKSTTCGHIFCNVCIETAIRMQHQCPTCRKRLTLRSIHPLFI
ncbi:hypothetical protein EGW08_017642 [Elysia chlorotica]|uniref:RING-type domain-containing protein n=1 Tax=Elysia chlorotica TaxID=188477 RepID=A0A433SZK4_ELYCH|nr:hypothetical protein EGW08_017642 [Elysia chlorotica]